MLLITHQCNLRCSYCYEPKKAKHTMTFDNAKQYIEKAVSSLDDSFDSFEIQYMGGEPLMQFPLIQEVSEWLWNSNFDKKLEHIFAPTNGTLLDDRQKQWFSINKERICLGLSFDGNRLMQNINRTDSFAKVDLDFFLSTWPNQSIKMTVSPQTLPYLYDGVSYLHNFGFKYIVADLAMGNNVEWRHEDLQIIDKQLSLLSDFYLKNPDVPCVSLLNKDLSLVISTEANRKKCSCGESLQCIDYDGEVYACHLFSPVSVSLEEARKSQRMDYTDYSSFKPKVCGDCLLYPLCPTCYGMNFKCYGNIAEQPPSVCSTTKIIFLANCEFQIRRAYAKDDKSKVELINNIVSLIEL